jgi:hypothetical protein
MLLKYGEKPEPEEPSPAEAISQLSLIEKGYSVIYKVCGCFGMYGSPTEDETIIVSDGDFFSLAKNLEKLIPDYLGNWFSWRSFLFVGHNFDEWQERLILDTILQKKSGSQISYAVSENPTPYESAYWKAKAVTLYRTRLEEFVNQLSEHMEHMAVT